VLLAFQPADYIRETLERGLTGFTDKTVTEGDEVLSLLDEVRMRDYAVDDEESEVGLRAVAAPVRNQNGGVIAALGVAAPVQRMNKRVMQTTVPTVMAIAQAVSTRLGFSPARRRSG
jgi:IclR family KDG regulon transcriptional repressor